MRKKTIVCIICVLLILAAGGFAVYVYAQDQMKVKAEEKIASEKKEEKRREATAKKMYEAMFSDKQQVSIQLEISTTQVDNFQKEIKKLKDQAIKKVYLDRIKSIRNFIAVRDEARSFMPDSILKVEVVDEQVQTLQGKFNALEEGFRPVLQEMMNAMDQQRSNLREIDALMANFYTGDQVKETINVEELRRAKELLKILPQKDVVEKYQGKLDAVQQKMDEIEARAKAAIEAQRQAAIQAQIAESQRIEEENRKAASSNVVIGNIPLINQKLGVLNGCEGASLLMALQHFGYCTGMSLHDIATAMPKSDDPHKGFIHDIFTAEPTNVPHWIAPDALSAFGQSYYTGVQNFTGASPEQLRAEIDQGNPVIFYATYGFYPAQRYVGEVPVNLHVMLLIGYNSYTGAYIVADPWGGIVMNVSKTKFENSYNALRYAVAVRGGGSAGVPATSERNLDAQ